jgi:hypothetical protein
MAILLEEFHIKNTLSEPLQKFPSSFKESQAEQIKFFLPRQFVLFSIMKLDKLFLYIFGKKTCFIYL